MHPTQSRGIVSSPPCRPPSAPHDETSPPCPLQATPAALPHRVPPFPAPAADRPAIVNRTPRRPTLAIVLALLLCAGPAAALERVSLQLKWRHQFQFAGYYVAQQKGYYRDAGLDVRILEAGDQTNPVSEVLTQRSQFGTAGPELAMVRAQGQPVVALAAIIQHSPLTLFTRGDVESVQDLRHKRIMLLPYETELFAFLKREGIGLDQFQAVPHSFSADDLMTGRVDALSGYVTDEPFEFKARRFAYRQFSPRAAGIDFYGDCLFTSEKYLDEHPQEVAAFRAASLRGWRYAVDHPDEAADLILANYSRRHNREHLLEEAREIRRLMYPDLVEIGQMSPGRWQHIAEIYAEAGLIPRGYDIDGLIYKPHPPIVPPWLAHSLWAALVLLAVISLVAWRLHRVGRRLERTLAERDQALADLGLNRERLRILLDDVPVAVVAWREDNTITEWNRSAERTFGWRRREAIGASLFDLLVAETQRQDLRLVVHRLLLTDQHEPHINSNRTKDGRTILCAWINTRFRSAPGQPQEFISIAQDITEQTRIADALAESERRYRTLTEITPFPVVVSRIADGGVVFCNQRARERLDLGSGDLEGLSAPKFWERPQERETIIARLQERGFVFDHEAQLRTLKGTTFWARVSAILIPRPGGASEAFVSFTDVTESKQAELELQKANMDLQLRLLEIEELQSQLREQAVRDSLTGLYNRRYLTETLERELARARREGHPLALVLIDLDHFKRLNDSRGHQAGDAVLSAVADCLQADIRAGDLACRYGGEEFLILLPGMGLDKAVARAEIWRQAFHELDVSHRGEVVAVTASFGVAVYPEHGQTPEALIQAADSALYVAKGSGRDRVAAAGPR